MSPKNILRISIEDDLQSIEDFNIKPTGDEQEKEYLIKQCERLYSKIYSSFSEPG